MTEQFIKEGLQKIIEESNAIDSYIEDDTLLIDKINSLPLPNRQKLYTYYSNRSPGYIVDVRKLVAERLFNRSITLQEVNAKIDEQKAKKPTAFRSYRKLYSILFPFITAEHTSIHSFLSILLPQLVKDLGLENIAKVTYFDFQGPRQQGSHSLWFAIYNKTQPDQSESKQIFGNFEHGTFSYGIYIHKTRKNSERFSITNTAEFTYQQMLQHLEEAAEEIKNDVLRNGSLHDINLNDANLFKISHGSFKTAKESETLDEIKKRNWIVLHETTGYDHNGKDGELFKSGIKVGDYVYITIGGDYLFNIAKVISEPDYVPQELIDEDGWLFREVEYIQEPINSDLKDLKGYNSKTYPSYQSAIAEIAVDVLDEMNEALFIPHYNIRFIKPKKEIGDNFQMPSLNTILYGPPGTGKTYSMRQLITSMNVIEHIKISKPDFDSFVDGYKWWELVALVLLDKKTASVPEIMEHDLIKAKLSKSNIQHRPQRIWSTLQHHTVLNCPNVKFDEEKRHSKPIFYKEENSIWRLDNESDFKGQLPFLVEDYEKFKKTNVDSKTIKHYTFTTCHQSLTYEDFIEGLKPVLTDTSKEDIDNSIQYEIRNGYFYQACEKAAQRAGYVNLAEALADTKDERKRKFREAVSNNHIYVLFLDEINRCNISSVFGELITLIEEDKRLGAEHEIVDTLLPYSQTLFGVPSNLYIIGTMNTADRSVEALDTALRRRFIFEELIPKPQLIQELFEKQFLSLCVQHHHLTWEDPQWVEIENNYIKLLEPERYQLFKQTEIDNYKAEMSYSEYETFWKQANINLITVKVITALNERIDVLLDRDHLIGHSYFIGKYTWDSLKITFYKSVIPLLREYFYGDYGKIGLVIGSNFFENSGKQLQSSENLFAEFDEYDAGGLIDKQIYRLKDISQMTNDEFIKAILKLLNIK